MSSKLKISKTQTQADDTSEDQVQAEPVVEEATATNDEPVNAPTEVAATETPTPEDYGKGGVYRSIGGGKRVRI